MLWLIEESIPLARCGVLERFEEEGHFINIPKKGAV